MRTLSTTATVLSAFVVLAACGSSPGEQFNENASTSGASGNSVGSSSGGGVGSSGGASSSGAPDGGEECAAQEAAVTLVKRPVDVVFVIDNSGSMTQEIVEVEKQINLNFAGIIGASGIDYRVIMLSKHGKNASQDICVSQPLSGGSCSPLPLQPLETERFFHHSVNVESYDSLCLILSNFSATDQFGLHPNGYGELLRPNALKVFLEISDDRVNVECGGKKYDDKNTIAGGETAAARFDTTLLALSPEQFGTVAKRNYQWHSIIGLSRFDESDPTLAHPVDAPIVTDKCSLGSANPGTGYQALSKLTGGLRYPSCETDYTTIFQRIAEGIVEGSALSCEFALPTPPEGQSLDLSTVVARFTPTGGGAVQDYLQVANAAACTANAFYIEGDTIKLCPAACDQTNATPGDFKIAFGCNPDGPR